MKLDSTMTIVIVYAALVILLNVAWTCYTTNLATLEAKSGLHTQKYLFDGQPITVVNITLFLIFIFCIIALR